MATSGWGVYEDILNDYLATREHVSLNTKPQIFAFFMKFWKDLHEHYSFVKDQTDEDDASPFGELDSSFLIANHRGIFMCLRDMSITKVRNNILHWLRREFRPGNHVCLIRSEL